MRFWSAAGPKLPPLPWRRTQNKHAYRCMGRMAMPDEIGGLESGTLVRVLPDWHQDLGEIPRYFTSQKLLPAKTRAFVDQVTEQFRAQDLAQRFHECVALTG